MTWFLPARIALLLTIALTSVAHAENKVDGLSAPVRIEIEDRAIPTIIGEEYLDCLTGQGWMHARNRFFEMDMLRRQAAGELSGMVGAFAVESDTRHAILRRRPVARRILTELPKNQLEMLQRYTQGVNAGLDSMSNPPVEYQTLGAEPAPWQAEDCVLVMLTMFDMLARQDGKEESTHALRKIVPPAYADWLLTQVGRYERLLIQPDEPEVVPIPPSADVIDVRKRTSVVPIFPAGPGLELHLGSNNFAVAGSRTADCRAILANDPHLMITAPSIWYRMEMKWPEHRILGVSLPGVPGIVIGTNGHVAFGLTNTTGDFRDRVIIEVDPDDPTRYRVPEGWESFDDQMMRIDVRSGDPVELLSRWTRWGPVIDEDHQGRPIAIMTSAMQPGAVNFGLHGMADARNVDDAIEVARQWNGPSQNVLVADSDGRIGWVVTGWIPNRKGHDGRTPVSLADGTRGWDGPLPEELRPVVVDPEDGILFTANSRTLPLEISGRIGNNFADPCRSHRIHERLKDMEDITELDLLELQLDDFAQLMVPYRPLYLEGLRALPPSPERDRIIEIIETWDGRATIDNLALAPLEDFRSRVISRTRSQLLRPFSDLMFQIKSASQAITEHAVLAGFETRPGNLFIDGEKTWHDILVNAAASTLKDEGAAIALETWGEVNRASFKHPMAMASPMLGTGFDLPSTPQSGYRGAVRVAHPVFGASARIVVSPDHLEDAILQTPGGQSGDPYSIHYTDLHEAWLDGTPMPLLSGPSINTLELVPTD